MDINITNNELAYLLQILEKEHSFLDKEIHRTDALVYKHELEDKARALDELKNKLQKVLA